MKCYYLGTCIINESIKQACAKQNEERIWVVTCHNNRSPGLGSD